MLNQGKYFWSLIIYLEKGPVMEEDGLFTLSSLHLSEPLLAGKGPDFLHNCNFCFGKNASKKKGFLPLFFCSFRAKHLP